MAIGFGAISAVSTLQNVTSVAVSGSDTLGIVGVVDGNAGADAITATTWNGVSMTKIGSSVQVPGDRWMSLWWIANPASSTTISFTGGAFWRSFNFYYTGASQVGQPDSSNTGTVSNSLGITVATTVVAANCWTIIFQKDNAGGITYTTTVGVMRANADGGGIAISDSNGTVGTGSQSTTLLGTDATAEHGAIAISISPAGGGGGASPTPLRMLMGMGS
jgi:hypothetical protein